MKKRTKTKIKKSIRFIKKNYKKIIIVWAIISSAGLIAGNALALNWELSRPEAEAIWPERKAEAVKEVAKEIKTENANKTIREITAYNAGVPGQTDSSPCISANGENVCTALALGYKRCAANFVPFGTKLRIENYGECIVTDRMNARYQNRVDIAMRADEIDRAIKFGKQNLMVEIVD